MFDVGPSLYKHKSSAGTARPTAIVPNVKTVLPAPLVGAAVVVLADGAEVWAGPVVDALALDLTDEVRVTVELEPRAETEESEAVMPWSEVAVAELAAGEAIEELVAGAAVVPEADGYVANGTVAGAPEVAEPVAEPVAEAALEG